MRIVLGAIFFLFGQLFGQVTKPAYPLVTMILIQCLEYNRQVERKQYHALDGQTAVAAGPDYQ
jgi:hypothetical protein